MRLLLFSDLHLETGFAWAPPEVGRARRDALRECLRRIMALASSLRVDGVCCGGDLYEHDRSRADTIVTSAASSPRSRAAATAEKTSWFTRKL